MKFLFYTDSRYSWDEGIVQLRDEFPDDEFIPREDITDDDVKNAHAFIGTGFPPDHLEAAKELKMIFVNFTGPNRLPLSDLNERGIMVSNTHGNARYVAERGIAMALSFYGRIMEYHNDLKDGKWHGLWSNGGAQDTWESIRGKECTVIGTGEIGKWLAKYLKIFECRVTGFKKRAVEGTLENFDEILMDLSAAVKKGELVFISLPLTRETKGMFDNRMLSMMKGKFLVNLGRAAIVDEEALYQALDGGILRGAALDVWYNYPKHGTASGFPSRYPFHELPNVILSPHIAGYTPQAAIRNVEETVENIRSYIRTGRARFEIDPVLTY